MSTNECPRCGFEGGRHSQDAECVEIQRLESSLVAAEAKIDRWRAVAEQQHEALKLAATLPCDWEAMGLPCRPGCVTCAARAAMGSFDAAVNEELGDDREMVEAAHELFEAASKYRRLYEAENGKAPVVWLNHDETHDAVFIADSYNTERIMGFIA